MMKKNILIYGIILGTILITNGLIMVGLMYSNPEFHSNDLLGYAFMVVVFSLVYFGVRNYRNKELGGAISFGKAFKVGALTTLVASTVYVLIWLFTYYLFVPDFLEVFSEHALYQCSTEAEIAAKKEEMEFFKEMYKNPLFVILLTYAEVLPMGLLITLISALILKKKPEKGN